MKLASAGTHARIHREHGAIGEPDQRRRSHASMPCRTTATWRRTAEGSALA